MFRGEEFVMAPRFLKTTDSLLKALTEDAIAKILNVIKKKEKHISS